MLQINGANIDNRSVRLLARNYNALDYSDKLNQLLNSVYPHTDFKSWEKVKLHELVNDVIINKHTGEQVLKYYLFQHFYKKGVIAAFEMKVNKSRVDFITINGCTRSFEIKSSLDNLYKLKKQSDDYLLAFDYNYLVIDEKHLENALQLIPSCFGVWSFSNGGKKRVHREALPNQRMDAEVQLRLLSKKELQQQFKKEKGIVPCILKEYKESEINSCFKEALKLRYQKRWNFLLAHRDAILPIDLQFFFNRNIEPTVIYND